MHGERKARSSSTPSQPMLTDETNANTSTPTESACLPIGCSVSAKYRGAFCSAQVKSIDRQVKLKVILVDTNGTIIISEDQIVQPAQLRIGNTVTIRLASSNHHDYNPHLSRSSLTAILNSNDNYDEKQAIIKQIYDNSIYTVVFNDGDEKSLRRSSLCLQGIRLYQTRIDQQKLIDDVSTLSVSSATMNSNDIASIVAVRRHGNNNNQQVFPALIIKRKSLSDYIWVKSFLDGREYIVHKVHDIEPYKNNSHIQSLCRLTSKQATVACEKFIKCNQIPAVWKKKKPTRVKNDDDTTSESNSSSSESDFDDSDDEKIEEKDSFIAQLLAFMDDRGTPLNHIPKVHNCDLDLHRLFNLVRILGGYNKVTKNDQWSKVYTKMGLPNEPSQKNGRLIEKTYKKYLFPYEDLSKKLGSMIIPSVYYGSRTSTNNDSRRSLIRMRRQSEEKHKSKQISTPIKQQFRKRQSVDLKPSSSSSASSSASTKAQPPTPRRKTIILNKAKSAILSSSTSDSDTSDDEITSSSSSTNRKKKTPFIPPSIEKTSTVSNDKKRVAKAINSSSSQSLTDSNKKGERSNPRVLKRNRSTTDTETEMKPVIKIHKINCEFLQVSANRPHKNSKKSTSTKLSKAQAKSSTNDSCKVNVEKKQSKPHTSPLSSPTLPESTKSADVYDIPPALSTILTSPSSPSTVKEEPATFSPIFTTTESNNNTTDDPSVPSIFQTLIPSSPPSITNQQTNTNENFTTNSNKPSYHDENSAFTDKIDELPASPSKSSRHSMSSQNNDEIINDKQALKERAFIDNTELLYDDILVNDTLLIKLDLDGRQECCAKCIDKNNNKRQLYVYYNQIDSKYYEWIEIDRVIKRCDEFDDNKKELSIDINSMSSTVDNNEKEIIVQVEDTKSNSIHQDNGIWKSLEIEQSSQDEAISSSSNLQFNELNNQEPQPKPVLLSDANDEPIEPAKTTISIDNVENIVSTNVDHETKSSNNNEPIEKENPIQPIPVQTHSSNVNSIAIQKFSIENILFKPNTPTNVFKTETEIMTTSSTIHGQSTNIPVEPITFNLSCASLPSFIPDNRRIYTRQQKRSTFRDANPSQDSSICTKRKARIDMDNNSNFNSDCINNNDRSPLSIDQKSSEVKRCRTVGKRGGKRTVNQQYNENEDFHLNSPTNALLRQKIDDMFKNRTSRYNFLDLNSNLTGDNRLTHLKEHMRQCQKVFFNLKSALRKIEKQKQIFLRRQKLSNTEIVPYEIAQPTTNEVLLPSTCT